VVIIAGINKDLDKYLSNRRAKEGKSFFSKPLIRIEKTKPDEVPQDLETDKVRVIDDQEPGFWQRLFNREEEIIEEELNDEELARLEAMEVEIEKVERAEQAHPEVAEELEEVRESLLERFFSLFRGYQNKHALERKAQQLQYIEDEVVPKIDEDVKRVLKIIHKWLAKMPKRARDDFKKSKDFEEYRSLLEKYGVAKMRAPRGEPKKRPAKVDVTEGGDYEVLGEKK
jgi:hypothetical protein